MKVLFSEEFHVTTGPKIQILSVDAPRHEIIHNAAKTAIILFMSIPPIYHLPSQKVAALDDLEYISAALLSQTIPYVP